jgi:hypothetical protein
MRRAWLLLLLVCGCATYQSDLARGEKAFEQNAHERALAILRALEPDIDRLSPSERAQYAYLRGMTDYRIGYRSDARHWLAYAQAVEAQHPNSLKPDWGKRLSETMKELNEEVYTGGVQSLSQAKRDSDAEEKRPRKKEPPAKPKSEEDLDK